MRREILLGIYYPQLSLIIKIGNCSMYQIGTLDIPILQMPRLLEQYVYVCTYFYCTRRGMVYYPLSEKKYWKIPRGVMVIPRRKNIGFSSEEPKAPRKKIQYFSEGLPSTPSGIFQYFFSDKG